MALSLILSFQRVSKWKNSNGWTRHRRSGESSTVRRIQNPKRMYSILLHEVERPEMEFLDINLTKDSSLLLHAILLSALKENHTLLWF
jgi:hypothetical protein